jgi:predicted ATPase
LDSPGGQSRVFDGVSQVLLAATAGSAPGVMLFDDLQWSDASSLQLIAYLARRMREQPRCLLLVWRTEDVPPGHPLRRILAEAEREGRGTAVILRRLDAAGVVALAAALRPAAPPPDFVERLFRETEGLPFFVVTYLRVLGEDPGLSSAAWPLPTGGRDFLRARLAALSGAAHQLLGAAAVIGRSFDFDTLRTTSGRSDEETLMALEELIARGVVVEADVGVGATPGPDRPHPGYDFCHEKLRSLVYDETSLARRRLLHRRVAGALVGQRRGGRAGSDLGTIAHHYQLAGLEDVAARYHRLAGERARSLYANREALAHFQAAIALGHPEPADLHEMIGDLLTLLGEFGAALRSYETAAAIAEPARVAGLERKLGTIYERRGEWELAESHFAIALDRLEAEGPAGERAQLFADWSLTAHRQGRSDRARGLASRALEFARDAGDRRALARAHNLLGILASRAGDLAGARRHLEDSLAISEEAADLAARTAALNNLALVCMQGGEVDRAIQLARTALALCRAQGDRHREAALHNNLADLHHARGDAAASLDHLRQAVAIYADIGVEAGAVRPEIWKLAEW